MAEQALLTNSHVTVIAMTAILLLGCAICSVDAAYQLYHVGKKIDFTVSEPKNINMSYFKTDIAQVCAGYGHAMILDINGTVYTFGDNRSFQCGVDKATWVPHQLSQDLFDNLNITSIAAGYSFSVALADNGKVCGCGKVTFSPRSHEWN